MRKSLMPVLFLFFSLSTVCGCSMFRSWQSIPPPGGCDHCHTVAISNDWRITYRAPNLIDERNREEFQTPQSTMVTESRPATSLDVRKVRELPCFDCHRSPNARHLERKGRYHH